MGQFERVVNVLPLARISYILEARSRGGEIVAVGVLPLKTIVNSEGRSVVKRKSFFFFLSVQLF